MSLTDQFHRAGCRFLMLVASVINLIFVILILRTGGGLAQ